MIKLITWNIRTAEKPNTFRYRFTSFDKDGWADAQFSLPIPFDLVTIMTEKGAFLGAWWTEQKWDGLRLKSTDLVVKWKRRKYDHIT